MAMAVAIIMTANPMSRTVPGMNWARRPPPRVHTGCRSRRSSLKASSSAWSRAWSAPVADSSSCLPWHC
ncbi:hypothetical protein C6A85_12690, partial [Mycobacterium sp. ITM-2017-0098]